MGKTKLTWKLMRSEYTLSAAGFSAGHYVKVFSRLSTLICTFFSIGVARSNETSKEQMLHFISLHTHTPTPTPSHTNTKILIWLS